ncbi:MAG: PEP-CTERM sorting domain-containing protein [Okeania sp. SIO3C4]|nr:PEP-CTERM sorting domain-containing protein [Okeania sp. SIO3C4]
MSALSAKALSLRNVTGLQSITFFERTGGTFPQPYTFAVDSSELLNRLSTLNSSSYDFSGASTELYDVFYSDRFGNLDINGEYLTVESVFSYGKPFGGGLNLSGVRLNFANATEFANLVTDFTVLGNNGNPNTVGNAIDGNLLTHTTMGNTIGQSDQLSVTLGFASSSVSVPEPSLILGFFALGGLGVRSLLKHKFQ